MDLSRTLRLRYWNASSFYFLFFGSMACLIPYLALYYQSLGLDARQIGLLVGLPAVVNVFSTPIWTGYADATRRHRLVFGVLSVGTLAFVIALSQARNFGFLLVIILTQSFFYSAISPLVDNTVMVMLGEQRAQYGKLRMWGAVGWGLAAPLMGWFTDAHGLLWAFGGFSALFVGAALVGQGLPLDLSHVGQPFWRGMQSLLTNRRLALFLGLVFVGGMAQSSVNNFLFLHLDKLGATQIVMGLALTISTLSEIPMLFFSDRMLRRFGARGMLILAMSVYALRLLLYSLSGSAWLVLLIQLLHGFTYSAMWVAGVSYANEIAPPGLGATAQGLFATTTFGISVGIGSLLAGMLYQAWGGRMMYLVFALFVTASLGFYWLAEKRLERAPARPNLG